MGIVADMKHVALRIGAIVLALAGSTGMMFLLFLIIHQLAGFQQAPQFALPASRTVAVFFRPEVLHIQRFQPVFPALQYAPGALLTALVKDNDHAVQLVHVYERAAIDAEQSVLTPLGADGRALTALPLGEYVVYAQDSLKSVLELAINDPLSRSPAFKALVRMQSTASSTYLVLTDVPYDLSSLDVAILSDATHVLFAWHDGGYTAFLYGAAPVVFSRVLSQVSLPAGSALAVAAADPLWLWNNFLTLFSVDDQRGMAGAVDHRVRQSLGQGVSLTYDVFALLHEPSVWSLLPDSNGRVRYLLEGSQERADQLTKRLERLHGSVRQMLSAVSIVRTSLPDVELAFVQHDPQAIEQRQDDLGTWIVKRTLHRQADDRFYSAQSGKHYVLSNRADTLTGALLPVGQEQHFVAAHKGLSPVAAGVVDWPWAEQWLQRTFPFIAPLPPLRFFWLPSSKVRWQYSSSGIVRSLTVLPLSSPVTDGSSSSAQ